MRIISWSLGIVVALAWVGCGPAFDEQTGGDGSRGEAQEIAVDGTYDDRLSAGGADNTDWKKFTLDADSNVAIKVWWDNPNVSAKVQLRDELGQKLKAMSHQKGERKDRLGPVPLKEGTYYLEFALTSGDSVYTFQVAAEASGSDEPDF